MIKKMKRNCVNNQARNKTTKRAAAPPGLSFPEKVYQVLQLCEENGRTDITSWMNHGAAFKVHDFKQFERDLLPRCFNTKKYATFTRMLRAHGFIGVRTGRQTGIYSHPAFRRNNPDALSLIRRVQTRSPVFSNPYVEVSSSLMMYAFLEPRTIQEMKENPVDLNIWYKFWR
ncbi:unnamed protein product [Cylindrotheca closterium]|uniref:HSF-type DNA-binding domain-containing protein n=1 Tax=Cylindrotheca closterium TaxID=2856 RepID=A0AAD2G4U7_9STRA|nr:unnamed protein product [Cylindrotheca closterium]